MREIPMPPDRRPMAQQTALDAARNDDGLRVSLVRAIWRDEDLPTAAAEHGGYVYEIADRVARAVEKREQEIRDQTVANLRRAAAGRREYAEGLPERKAGATVPDASLAEMRETLLSEAACYETAALIVEDPSHLMGAVPSWRWTDEEAASIHPPKETNHA
jgi:hypothetical protein